MRTLIPFLFVVGVSITPQAIAQIKDSRSSQVTFDPLFWKNDLKLSKKQYATIEDINAEFYTSLVQATRSITSSGQLQIRSSELIRQRSTMIWNVFSFRQKVKWGKISAL